MFHRYIEIRNIRLRLLSPSLMTYQNLGLPYWAWINFIKYWT